MKKLLAIFCVACLMAGCCEPKKYEVGQIKTNMGEILVWITDILNDLKPSFVIQILHFTQIRYRHL